MAGIGKLAKLGKTLLKGVSYLPKKAWQLQKPFEAAAGEKLSTGKKIANCVFKTTQYASTAGIVGATGASIYEAYKADNSDSHKEFEEHSLKLSKYFDTAILGAAGLLLGGPIGALALGAAAYFTPKDIVLGNAPFCKHGGKDVTLNELRKEREQEAAQAAEAQKETSAADEQKQEKVEEEKTPEVKADEARVNEFCDKLKNLQVGQTITVPELNAESGALTLSAGDQQIELKPGDKITRTAEGLEITRADAQPDQTVEETKADEEAAPADSTATVQTDSIATAPIPTAPADSTATEQTAPTAPAEQPQQPQQPQAPEQEQAQPVPQSAQGNLFGGEINGITTQTHEIRKNDCLWNIAKKYLQDANPGKTITNAQILKQVKEFGRLNPEMFGQDPTLEKLDLIYPNNNLKLCA